MAQRPAAEEALARLLPDGGEPPAAAVKAVQPQLSAAMDARAALEAIAAGCLRQLHANRCGLLAHGYDAEFVHQMRVALRRLRSNLRLFLSVAPGSDLPAALTDGVRALAAALGEARDLDVFGEAVLPRLLDDDPAAFAPLVARAQAAREQAHANVRQACAAPAYGELVRRLQHWLRQPQSVPLDRRLSELAPGLLESRWRRLLERGRGLRHQGPHRRHRTRICAKRMRYAADAFAPIYAEEATGPFLKALAKLQDELGLLNDLATAPRLVDRLGADTQTVARTAAWCERRTGEALARLRAGWKRCKAAEPFWR